MATFITEDFLLTNRPAVELYHQFAEPQPIIDYHCHVPAQEIAEDRRFANMTQIWLAGDHYKWRAMRAAGVPELLITGDASDWEKFHAWSEVVPKTIRNPLYHWTHMELKRPLGISDLLLNEATAKSVWNRCNRLLADQNFSARGIIRQMHVKAICTTDDPADSLEHHAAIRADSACPVVVAPAFRADNALKIEGGSCFTAYLRRLEQASNKSIGSFQQFIDVLAARHEYFHGLGCRLSDYGLETVFAEDYTEREVESIFQSAISGKTVDTASVLKFRSAVLWELCLLNSTRGWVQQFHLGALRNVNPRAFRELGPDTGFDTMGRFDIVGPLAKLLGKLENRGALAKTIIYNSNPADNEVIASLTNSFQDGLLPGKIQYGSAWWFMDQKDGIERQLNALSNMGLISQFIGMLTDSRSLLSYSRHDYFRRVLCSLLGSDMENGLLPNDFELIGDMVEKICYGNALEYFDFVNSESLSAEATLAAPTSKT